MAGGCFVAIIEAKIKLTDSLLRAKLYRVGLEKDLHIIEKNKASI